MSVLTQLGIRRAAGRLRWDVQAVHRTVEHVASCSGGRVLWAQPEARTLIVQSDEPVRVSHDDLSLWVRGQCEVDGGFVVGEAVELSLIACPVWSDVMTGKKRRRALPIDECADWFARKLDGAVEVSEVQVQDLGWRRGKKTDRRVTFRLVAFSATGTVTGPDHLTRLRLEGIGPHKAYGAGLLLVRRLTT